MFERPVWAEIDLSAIKHNVREIKRGLRPGVKFCAVVKADAYGHGAVAVSQALLTAGADRLAVAIVSEAIELRRAGIVVPVQVLGYTPPEQALVVAKYDIAQTVYSLDMVRALAAAGAQTGKQVKLHIKIDTGMGRIGILPEEAGEFAAAVANMAGVEIEGVFSHFATADEADKSYAEFQYARFEEALQRIKAKGIHVPLRHMANSAATLELPQTHLDMVRPGIILYGLWPSPEVNKNIRLKPAMCLKAQVAHIKTVAAGAGISYGRTYIAETERKIATLPIGYADGWRRELSGRTEVLINGGYAPLVGRICMDQCMADVTGIAEVKNGDTAILFGVPELTTDKVAEVLGTITYELVCMVGERVPRIYINR
ncbi:alanine racemase [Sporomusa sphaeroides]|uniref:alanine racemase n=1 Tax=Sporomusa sphaeroides TaxID=47679 RepID=UPI002BF1E07D|nr:alanine racemase [Sporomusa sphaeroides]HML32579.1 alanine racemase [Sporomusa sphaeroides]